METRDKVLVLIVLGWIAAAVWFKISTDKASDEMSKIREMINNHVQTVNNEFRDNLYDLELNFIGREEHLQAAQDSIY